MSMPRRSRSRRRLLNDLFRGVVATPQQDLRHRRLVEELFSATIARFIRHQRGYGDGVRRLFGRAFQHRLALLSELSGAAAGAGGSGWMTAPTTVALLVVLDQPHPHRAARHNRGEHANRSSHAHSSARCLNSDRARACFLRFAARRRLTGELVLQARVRARLSASAEQP